MARFLSALLMAALFVLPSSAFADVPKIAIEAMTGATVIVHGDMAQASENSDGGQRQVDYCSGVTVGRQGALLLIATARHCATYGPYGIAVASRKTTDAKPTSVRFRDGRVAAVERVLVSSVSDLALLYVHAIAKPATRATELALGESIYVYGQPFGFPWTLSEGYITQGRSEDARALFHDHADDPQSDLSPDHYTDLMMVCTGCGPGDSGGGVWDARGHLVGILTAGAGNFFLFVPVRRVYALMVGIDPGGPPHNSMIDTPGAVDWQTR